MNSKRQYKPLTARAIVELAAPHTWPASILPVGLGTALSCALKGSFHAGILLSTLFAAVLLQCAVNTLNDYADFVKGTDTRDNSHDATDAALIYHSINPRSALKLGGAFLLCAFLAGIYTIVVAGWIPLVIGIIGGGVVIAYSMGRLPLSYLPIGEFISGFVMGGGITLACFVAQSGVFSLAVFWYALPMMITIGLIMLTNNTCDIAKDRKANRRTFPVVVGHTVAAPLLKRMVIVAQLLVLLLTFLHFRQGLFLAPALLIATGVQLSQLWNLPITASTRGPSMGSTLSLHTTINVGYILMIALHLLQNML